MRRLILLGLATLALAAFTPARDAVIDLFSGQGPPINLTARQETYRGDPLVLVSFTDTNSQTVIRTDIRRRGTRADTLVGGRVSDTVWVIRGYTTGKADSINATARARMTFRDPGVVLGRTYRYQARDSVSGAALTTWSDSVSITVTNFSRSQ
jgi:hypothetical protein